MLRTFPPLNARSTIALCCQFVRDLPQDLHEKLVRHVCAVSAALRADMHEKLMDFLSKQPWDEKLQI
jgi:hypothetical protein